MHPVIGGSTVSRWSTTRDEPFVRARSVSPTGTDDTTSSDPCSTLNLPFELSAIVLVLLALWGRRALPKL